MKYVQPYGISDPNAHYINGDPSEGIQGSIPPAAAFENPQREIMEVITANGVVPSDADLTQMLQATRSQFANYCVDTGSINNLSVALNPPLPKYTVGLPLRVRVSNSNTSAVTIDAGCGRVYVRRPDGSNVVPGDLPAGGICDLVFDGTGFQMVNYLGMVPPPANVINNYNNIPYAVDTSPTANVIVAPFSPAITSVKAGDLLLVKVANTTTGPTTLQVNALPAAPVKTLNHADLLQNDIGASDIKLFVFDGTIWQITPNLLITAAVTANVPAQYSTVGACLQTYERKRIGAGGSLLIKMAAGNYTPFSIHHPDADRITVAGTMLGAAPTIGEISRRGADYNSRMADAWANHALLLARYGTVVYVAAQQMGVMNVGPGSPLVRDILFLGPFAEGSQGPGFTWDFSNAVWCDPGRIIRCVNVAAWGMGWACFEGQGSMINYNCITCASVNGASSRYNGMIRDTYCIHVGHAFTGINADEDSDWIGESCYVQVNGIAGLQPLVRGFCHASNCSVNANGVWDVMSIATSVSWLPGTYWVTAVPPVNGGLSADGSMNYT